MADDIQPGLGAFLSIVDDATPDQDEAGYIALLPGDTLEIGELTDIPEYGPEHETVTHVPLRTGITQKFHGAINQGSLSVPMALSRTDAGQVAIRAALAARTRVTFVVTFADGTRDFCQGKVMSFTRGASINGVVQATVKIEIETEIIAAPAVA